MPPGVIVAPGSTPTANFTINPATVALNDAVVFDGSGAAGGRRGGDADRLATTGRSATGAARTGRVVTHAFHAVGVSNSVTLTVTNDLGLTLVAHESRGRREPARCRRRSFRRRRAGPVIGQAVCSSIRGAIDAGPATRSSHTGGRSATAPRDRASPWPIPTRSPTTYSVQSTVVERSRPDGHVVADLCGHALGNPTAVLALIKQGPSPARAHGAKDQADGSASLRPARQQL